jgi:hypothetical protein
MLILINSYCVSYKETEKRTAINNESAAKQLAPDGTMIQSPGLPTASCSSSSLPHEGYTYLEPLAHEKHQTFIAIVKTMVLVRPFCPTYHIYVA